ncbi:ABC transporter ATP-binding protein [Acidihalobacter ferrooxydans]|uniref:ABC transporter ATP-binding protein n=1 Tax=Acidihalobacter ferrooxydans TaxID=1765967 RepID=A0A1P8UG84_9GAMM|nr:ABC transporter ATP-binding protein [Acidihalobacter ferrooxydans]APZ42825.1 ABC transporter ATP-binding protein [Acidihalobacter ferrooxydans]
MSGPAIIVEHVSKDFVLHHNAQDSLKKRFIGLFYKRWRPQPHIFHAVDDVSFTVERGEALGLMGHNGSGKSTLLSLIAGIYPTTSGRILTRGRLVPMIALGVGFSPELTGEENIYLNASLFGLKNRETRTLFPKILEFSELGDFIYEPVKNYSSGMHARLGFSVAIHLDPEILLADEILSVGDADFQQKCLARIEDMRKGGMTLLFVSHSEGQVVQFCDRYIRMEHGKMIEEGDVADLIDPALKQKVIPIQTTRN